MTFRSLRRVEYQAVYPGVDLVYYGDQGQLEYDFRVAPAADPNQIALSFKGAASTRIEFRRSRALDRPAATSAFTLRGSISRMEEHSESDRGKFPPACGQQNRLHHWRLRPQPRTGHRPDSDLFDLPWRSGTEGLVKVAVDSGGLIYLAGSTDSADFPPLPANNAHNPPFQPCLGEPGVAATSCTASTATNIFIAVINPGLQPTQQLVYWTYLGGTQIDSLGRACGRSKQRHLRSRLYDFFYRPLFPYHRQCIPTGPSEWDRTPRIPQCARP